MKNKKSSMSSDVDKFIYGYFDSKMSNIETKYPFGKSFTVVSGDRFEKRKDRVINFAAAACIALIFGLGALNFEPPRTLEAGMATFFEKHDLNTQIPEVIDKVKEIINQYKD